MGSKLGDRNKRHDRFYKRAQKEHFASRAVYKLDEMDTKFQLLKKGHYVLDLGAAPGAWSQLAATKIGPRGRLIGIDLLEIKAGLPTWATFIQGDMREIDFAPIMADLGRPFDCIMSDMAPNTVGVKFTDAVRSSALVMAALDLVPALCAPHGKFVAKIFRGEDFEATLTHTRSLFKKTKVFKPESSRQESKEVYIVAWEKRETPLPSKE